MVSKVADDDDDKQPDLSGDGRSGSHDGKPSGSYSMWKTFAFFSGALLQLVACMVVFAYMGRLLGARWERPWLTAVGVLVGLLVGISNLTFLIKRILGEKP